MEPKSIAPEFKSLALGVRPARIAVLVDRTDDDWQNTCIRLLEFFTTVWGGNHSLIVPTDGKSINELFWQLLEAFDPDYIYVYRKTLRDLKLTKPAEYAVILERETTRAGVAPEYAQVIKQIDELLCNRTTSQFQVAPELEAELRTRIAPLYFMEHTVQPGFLTADSEAHYPLTAIHGIVSNCAHTSNISIVTSVTEDIPEIWYASVTGSVRESYSDKLKECGIELSKKEFGAENAGDLIELGVLRNAEDNFPFSLSRMKLAYYGSIKIQH